MQCRIITSKDNTEVSIKERVPQEITVKRYKFLLPIWRKKITPLKQIPRRCSSSLESHLSLLWQWPALSAPKTFVIFDKHRACKEWPGETNRRKGRAGQGTYWMLYCCAHQGGLKWLSLTFTSPDFSPEAITEIPLYCFSVSAKSRVQGQKRTVRVQLIYSKGALKEDYSSD